MRYGRLDRRIAIQRKTTTPSASGQPVVTWSTIATAWASVAPARGGEGYSRPQIVAQEQTEFRVRWSSTVRALNPGEHRIVYPVPSGTPAKDTIYDVRVVHELGRREGLQIIAERRPDT